MAVWMSFINPTKFSSGMNVAQPPRKRKERERGSGILTRGSAKGSGNLLIWSADIPIRRRSCHKSPQIPKQLEMRLKYADYSSVWYFPPLKAWSTERFVYIWHSRWLSWSSKRSGADRIFTDSQRREGKLCLAYKCNLEVVGFALLSLQLNLTF